MHLKRVKKRLRDKQEWHENYSSKLGGDSFEEGVASGLEKAIELIKEEEKEQYKFHRKIVENRIKELERDVEDRVEEEPEEFEEATSLREVFGDDLVAAWDVAVSIGVRRQERHEINFLKKLLNNLNTKLTKTLVRNTVLEDEYCRECGEPLGKLYYFIEFGDEIWHVCKKCGDSI